MADYCTLDDIKVLMADDLLVSYTNDSGGSTIVTTVTSAIISNASALIDSYLQERYTLPLPSTPPSIKALCVTIAIYRIYCRRESVPDAVADEYKAAIKKLEKIATGDLSLGVTTISEVSAIKKNKDVTDRVFRNPQGYFL